MNKVFQIQESMLAFISQYEEQEGARDYPLSWERVHMASCARIGVLGLTFKENVPDLRNTKVVDIIRELGDFRMHVLVHDPMASAEDAREEYGLTLVGQEELRDLDALIIAVNHDAFKALSLEELATWFRPTATPILIDVKGIHERAASEAAGFRYWRL